MGIHFKDKLREAVLMAIDNVLLSDGYLIKFGWDNPSTRILNSLITEKAITEEEIFSKLHIKLKSLGRESFEQHKQGQYPDHTASPQALAYAIHNGEFTEKERASIKYDHEDTESSFIKSYNSGDLKQHILNQLLAERAPVSFNTDSGNCCLY